MTTCSLSFPSQVNLAKLPTPVQPLRRLSEKYGVELYVKRDDLTGIALSGNKIRKLEFVLADALAQKADTVITCGGAQSNHCRATAIAAAMLGIKCRLLLRVPDPSNPPPPEGNVLLDRMAGAEIVWITPDEYKKRDELMAREAVSLRATGNIAYTIPEALANRKESPSDGPPGLESPLANCSAWLKRMRFRSGESARQEKSVCLIIVSTRLL